MKRTAGRSWSLVALAGFLVAAGPAFADFEDDVERAWAGAWVVARVEIVLRLPRASTTTTRSAAG